MRVQDSIEKTKQSFEKSFLKDAYYNRQTRDESHLEQILNSIQIEPGMHILDLGTGTGYLAFPIAEHNTQVEVIGLDIVEKTLDKNQNRAKEAGLCNLQFVRYDGFLFPFEDCYFDLVITRYALHHFPDIESTMKEIERVLKPGGCFFLSDPAPNPNDSSRFVDDFMQMKKDGHIRFYSQDEWIRLANGSKLHYQSGYETTIRFPRKKEESLEFEDIIQKHQKEIIDDYQITVTEDEIWITEKVNNLLFQK